MKKSAYYLRAQKFIAQIFPYIDGCGVNCEDETEYRYALHNAITRFLRDHPNRKVDVSYGISRVALVTADYVVKIDYNPNSDFGTSADEVDAYNFVRSEGYDKYFAEISCYTYGGLDFYIMPRVRGIGRKWGDAWEYVPSDVSDFLNDYFYDLHNHNYGWKDNHVVIFDYAARA